MTFTPNITVAPNGARLGKADHPAVPLSDQELAETALTCFDAGANCIHLHVRDAHGSHSLDVDRYRSAIAAVSDAAPQMQIQITTEAAGLFDVIDQLALLQDLKPDAASIAVREIARSEDLAPQIYATAAAQGTRVQHIVYAQRCLDQLMAWKTAQIIPPFMRDVIVVLGQYAPARAGAPQDLMPLVSRVKNAGLSVTVCAFGASEQTCLLQAAELGCDLRVGFENNTLAPDGSPWANNAQAVASLHTALSHQQKGRAS